MMLKGYKTQPKATTQPSFYHQTMIVNLLSKLAIFYTIFYSWPPRLLINSIRNQTTEYDLDIIVPTSDNCIDNCEDKAHTSSPDATEYEIKSSINKQNFATLEYLQPRYKHNQDYMWRAKRIRVFVHSVMTNFNCACPAIQRGQGSGFLSEGSSWLTDCMSEQRRFWRDCANAQARLNLRCSHMQ